MAWLLEIFDDHTKEMNFNISEAMGGRGGISSSGDISINLENPEHVDCNDGTPVISLWTETEPGRAKNWYFLMPSTTIDGCDKPVALKLFHGAIIIWDGRLIRHCSSKPQNGDKHFCVHGFFCCCTNR